MGGGSVIESITNEEMRVLGVVARKIHALAREKGWHDDFDCADVFLARACSNLHAEVSELWESVRNNVLFLACDKAEKMEAAGIPPLTCVEEELADIVIRAFDNAERLNVDIGYAILRKHAFNGTRERRHGGKIA